MKDSKFVEIWVISGRVCQDGFMLQSSTPSTLEVSHCCPHRDMSPCTVPVQRGRHLTLLHEDLQNALFSAKFFGSSQPFPPLPSSPLFCLSKSYSSYSQVFITCLPVLSLTTIFIIILYLKVYPKILVLLDTAHGSCFN